MCNGNEIELDRQKEYIEKCRTYTAAFQAEHGRTPRACVTTFGCQMNTEVEIEKAA